MYDRSMVLYQWYDSESVNLYHYTETRDASSERSTKPCIITDIHCKCLICVDTALYFSLNYLNGICES